MSNDVEKIIEEIGEKIEKVSDFLTTVTDNELVKSSGEIFKFVDLGIKANNWISQKRFEQCLKGFTMDDPTEQQLNKLKKFIDSPVKAEFVANTFRQVLLSNSSKASLIMGTILNSVVNDEKEVTHETLICLNALSHFYDIDINNLKLLNEYIDYVGPKELKIPRLGTKKTGSFYVNGRLTTFAKEKNVTRTSLLLTLEKSLGLQLITKELEPDIGVDIDVDMEMADVTQDIDEKYYFNSVGKLMLSLIQRIEE
ncbi:hypothetical protein ACFTQ7_20615 [Lysinibacillus sp. NPDC056959]|uniref:hypothetical protein n=1 Tax=Lysinibacillus sp. NPDC056959 TaxID=3345981 RepID=UPI003639724C